MNRRGFLGSILASAIAPAIVRFDSLMPVRALAADAPLILPPVYATGVLLTPSIITQRALAVLERNLFLQKFVDRDYVRSAQWPSVDLGERYLSIRKPVRFA